MCVCDRVVWERYGKMVCVKVMCVFVRAAAVRTFSFPMSSARHTALLRTASWLNEVCQDLLWRIADPHDAAWKHQSMSLTRDDTKGNVYCCSYKT